VYFAVAETPSKAVDAAAWLTLLALFEAEASFAARLVTPRRRIAIRTLRLVAAAGVFAATIGYVFEDNRLDALNSALWIAVVVLLELELRQPRLVTKAPYAFGGAAVILYGSLGLLVVAWMLEGLWFDAYDAVLWLVAFVALERDVTKSARRGR